LKKRSKKLLRPRSFTSRGDDQAELSCGEELKVFWHSTRRSEKTVG
jgi:hypothetical protein